MKDLANHGDLNLYADLRSVTGEMRERLNFARLLELPPSAPFTGRLAGRIVRRDEAKAGLYSPRWSANRKCLLLDERALALTARFHGAVVANGPRTGGRRDADFMEHLLSG